MKSRDYLIFIFTLIFCFPKFLMGQEVEKMIIGINGLTCSQCSRSVEMQLKKIPYLTDINMDLAGTQAIVYINSQGNISLKDIPKAIKDAGFSIRFLEVFFQEPLFSEKKCVKIRGMSLASSKLNEERSFRIWHTSFTSRSIFANHTASTPECCKQCILLVPLKDWSL